MLKTLFLATVAVAMPAAATVSVTFDDLINSGPFLVVSNPYTSPQGVVFTNDSPNAEALIAWGSSDSANADPGGATLVNNYSFTSTTISGPSRFTLTAIDFADPFAGAVGGDILLRFLFTDSTTADLTLSLSGDAGLTRFTLGIGNLSAVTYTPLTTRGPWVQVDNVVLDDVVFGGVVPEPASWALMIAGFGLVGAAARRRVVVA
ncbi:PEPxxWA-CTERM sorting domain-containing protein [Sandaracinobacteroides saxicola]|uniref:PEPxxWA-CTERM sorting domain-containing protein n=1 Tax=Sandaracinobacteroides saxicola TaxID=2759707 RepID=A0A7G5IFR1_9SPHN|nr:PEPxxWA-CTERM sorting domain-containing protein [Sandaracinobacteroides saxicola]QMW22203.1 PEPxxWA-CTERM sorting domain-containing protein [Sandaracinobacteroides saxicola]